MIAVASSHSYGPDWVMLERPTEAFQITNDHAAQASETQTFAPSADRRTRHLNFGQRTLAGMLRLARRC